MILASWNVNSIKVRLPHVLRWLLDHKPDVLCIQETKIEDNKFPKEAFSEIGYDSVFYGQKTYNGVAIVSKLPITDVHKNFDGVPLPEQTRFLRATIDATIVICAYVPNGGDVGSDKFEYKLSWLAALRKYLDETLKPDMPVLICGDFNVAPEDRDVFNPELTRGWTLVTDDERSALANVRDWGFEDAFRLHVQDAGEYTWWDYRLGAFRRKMGFRIDHIWITKPLIDRCKRSWIDKEPRKLERPSDHTPIVVELS